MPHNAAPLDPGGAFRSIPMSRSRPLFGAFASAALVLCLLPAGTFAGSTTVTISQVYGGGGGSTGTYLYDYIELHNLSSASVDLTGWAVQYASATGSAWSATALTGSIPAGAYYLVQEGNAGSVGAPLPPPDK